MTGLIRRTIIVLVTMVPVASFAQEHDWNQHNAIVSYEQQPRLFDLVGSNTVRTGAADKRPSGNGQTSTPPTEAGVLLSIDGFVTRHGALSVTWAQPAVTLPAYTNAIPVQFGLVYASRRHVISRTLSVSVEDRDARDLDGVGLNLKGGIKLAF